MGCAVICDGLLNLLSITYLLQVLANVGHCKSAQLFGLFQFIYGLQRLLYLVHGLEKRFQLCVQAPCNALLAMQRNHEESID